MIKTSDQDGPQETGIVAGPATANSAHTKGTDLRYLKRSQYCAGVVRICAKHLTPSLTKREQREHVLSSLSWLAKKQGLDSKPQAQVHFWHNKSKKEGRLDLALYQGDSQRVMAVLVNFSPDDMHLDKLKGALNEGFLPVLVTLKSQIPQISQILKDCKLTAKFSSWLKIIYLDE